MICGCFSVNRVGGMKIIEEKINETKCTKILSTFFKEHCTFKIGQGVYLPARPIPIIKPK